MTKSEKISRLYVKKLGSQKAAAKALGASKQSFCQWFNGLNKAPLDKLLSMESALKGEVSRAIIEDENWLIAAGVQCNILKIFDVVHEAISYQQEGGERRRRSCKSALNGEDEKCPGVFLKKYTDVSVAKKFNLGSKDTYRRLKKIFQSKLSELMQAVEAKTISIKGAVILLEACSREELLNLLAQGKVAIKDFIKEKSLGKKSLINPEVVRDFYKKIRDAQTRYGLPLYMALRCLAENADAERRLQADLNGLANSLMLDVSVTSQMIEVLFTEDFLFKQNVGNKNYFVLRLTCDALREVPYA